MTEEFELSELPNGWEWQGGNRGSNFYTTNFGTGYLMGGSYAGDYGLGGMFGQVYWDGDMHHVEICHVERMNGDDPVFSYPDKYVSFETEEEAHEAVRELIQEL